MKIAYWNALRPGAKDWRNVLSEYDAVVYEIGDEPVTDPLCQALVEWPGLLVLRGDGLGDDPEWRARVLERAAAVIVDSRDLERRLRLEHPWAEVVFVDPAIDPAASAERHVATLSRARRSPSRWLEAVLESASAEIPGFFPGDRISPWRAEIDELLALVARRGR